MSREWWVPMVQWTLWGLVMAVVMGWVAKSRLRKRVGSERFVLKHPISTLVIGVVGAVLFFGVAVISNTIGKNRTATVWTTAGFIAFALAFLPMIADYFFGRHRVSQHGIEYGRMFGQRGSLRWLDVHRISFAPVMKWFVLESSSGEKVRVSAMLLGLPEFARLALLHVSKEAISPDIEALLRETAQGRLPSVWG